MFYNMLYWLGFCCIPIITIVLVLFLRDIVKNQKIIIEQQKELLKNQRKSGE